MAKKKESETLEPGTHLIPPGGDVVPITPMVLLQQAVNDGVDIDKLTALMGLQERWEANEARKAYTKAMAAFKAEHFSIDKNKTVSFGNTSYKHATLDNICNIVMPLLSRHFLSHKWVTKQENNAVSVTCTVTHVLGHSEDVTLSAPPDTSGSKNSIQSIASTVSYLERYTILAALGIAVQDQDNDGAGDDSGNLPKEEFNAFKEKLEHCQTIDAAQGVIQQVSIECEKYNDYRSATALKNVYLEIVNCIKTAASEK